jgi:hypothetical protein
LDLNSRSLTGDLEIRFSSKPTERKMRRPEVRRNQQASIPKEGESDVLALKTKHYPNQSSGSVIMSIGPH